MRLSAYVNQHGIDPFQFDDFVFVGKQVAHAPTPLIIVGGQALETWGHFFSVLSPTGEVAPLTEDTDFLGSKQDAIWLCKRLGESDTELHFAPANDMGPSTALAYIRRPDGRVLMMDFLRCIVGPDNSEIRKSAVPVRVADEVTLYVLHPLLCLESRMANLEVLPDKRSGNGPMQAQWGVSIVEAFLEKMASGVTDPSSSDQLAQACRKVAELAEYKNGRYCWINYGIDPLHAVRADAIECIGQRFKLEEWPRTVDRISRKRQRWERIDAATRARGK